MKHLPIWPLMLLPCLSALAQPGAQPPGSTPFLATGSTNPRTQAARAADIVNILDWAGVDPTGTTDSTTGVQNAVNAVGATCGTAFFPNAAKIRILSNLNVPACVTLQGALGNAGDQALVGSNPNYNSTGGIRLATSATITLNSASGARDLMVITDGVTFPVANASAYAGTAFFVPTSTADPFLKNVLIVGFNQAFVTQSQADRVVLRDVYADGVGSSGTYCPGVICLQGSYDTSSIEHVHLWPYGTVYSGTTTRAGTGLYTSGHSDGTEMDGISEIGHAIGINFSSIGELNIGRLYVDTNATTGVQFNNTGEIHINELQAWSSQVAVAMTASSVFIDDFLVRDVPTNTAQCITTAGSGTVSSLYIGTANFTSCEGANPISIGQAGDVVQITNLVTADNGIPTAVVPTGSTDTTFHAKTISGRGYVANGSGIVNLNLGFYSLASAATIALPPDTNNIEITGSTAISTINGQWGGRELLLKFDGNSALSYGGNISLGTIDLQSLPMSAGSTATLIYDISTGTWLVTSWQNRNPTKFTTTGCSPSSTTGDDKSGAFVSGTTGTCTTTITMNGAVGETSFHGWTCWSNNQTTANLMRETASNTTTATLSGTTVTGDTINFGCAPY